MHRHSRFANFVRSAVFELFPAYQNAVGPERLRCCFGKEQVFNRNFRFQLFLCAKLMPAILRRQGRITVATVTGEARMRL